MYIAAVFWVISAIGMALMTDVAFDYDDDQDVDKNNEMIRMIGAIRSRITIFIITQPPNIVSLGFTCRYTWVETT